MTEIFGLEGKVALVTGAAKGIGRETVLTLHGLGARVVASDIDATRLAELGKLENIRTAEHDVTSPDAWTAVIDGVAAQEGRLDVLVNNAGVILNRPFLDTSLEDLRRVMRINVEGVWLGMQVSTRLMADTAQDSPAGASIVNLSSIYGQVAGPMHAAYCASKGAVRMMTKAVAIEFARNGSRIRVNSVHPGPVETDLGMSGVHDAVAVGRLTDAESGRRSVAQNIPMGRWAQVEDVARVVAFLASDASAYVTAAELTVDGGMSAI